MRGIHRRMKSGTAPANQRGMSRGQAVNRQLRGARVQLLNNQPVPAVAGYVVGMVLPGGN